MQHFTKHTLTLIFIAKLYKLFIHAYKDLISIFTGYSNGFYYFSVKLCLEAGFVFSKIMYF